MPNIIAKKPASYKGKRCQEVVDILVTERCYCTVCDADFVPTKQHHHAGLCTVCFVSGATPVEIPRLELRP
jgi:hypothetical protein